MCTRAGRPEGAKELTIISTWKYEHLNTLYDAKHNVGTKCCHREIIHGFSQCSASVCGSCLTLWHTLYRLPLRDAIWERVNRANTPHTAGLRSPLSTIGSALKSSRVLPPLPSTPSPPSLPALPSPLGINTFKSSDISHPRHSVCHLIGGNNFTVGCKGRWFVCSLLS